VLPGTREGGQSPFLSHRVTFLQSCGGRQQGKASDSSFNAKTVDQALQASNREDNFIILLFQIPLSCLPTGDVSMERCKRSKRALQ